MKLVSGKGNNVKKKTKTNGNGAEAMNTSYDSRSSNTNTSATKPRSQNPTPQKPQTPKKKSGKISAGKVFLVIFLIVLLGFFAFSVAFGFYVDSLDTIFPNVWADGIDLSGLTLEEARLTLIDKGYESNASNVSATVVFSDGTYFTILGDDVGFSLNAEEAAMAAYNFGRGEGLLRDGLTYVKAFFTDVDLRDVSKSNFDEELVRTVAAEHTMIFNSSILDESYTIHDDNITIVKGAGVSPAFEDDVFELTVDTLYKALDEQNNITVDFVTSSVDTTDIDMQMLLSTIYVEPISAQYDPETYGATQSIPGRTFDVEEAQAAFDAAENGQEVLIHLVPVEPELSKEDLEAMLFRDILATSTTRIAGTHARFTNVRLASEEVNGTLLNPGEIFSFNAIVGRRTLERGFMEAGGFISGRLVDMVGGGICQVTSTMYDALLRTTIEVTDRRAHGLTIGYLPLGHDATVSYGSLDLKFKNNTDYPLRIDSTIDGREITVNIVGTKVDDVTIETRYEVISSTPYETIHQEDESVAAGRTVVETPGSTGYVVEVYQLFYDADGELIREKSVGRSTYSRQNRLILVPLTTHSNEQPYDQPGESDPIVDAPPTNTDPPEDNPPVDAPPIDNLPFQPPTDNELPIETPPDYSPEDDYTHEPPDDYFAG